MKENRNLPLILKSFFKQLLISPNSVPPFLQYFITLFQFFVFTVFIASNSIAQSLIFADVIQRNLIIFLVSLLVLRYLTGITLIKSIYVMIIVWNVQCPFNVCGAFVYVLLLLNVTIDIISKIEFSYQTKNMHSSTYPWEIILHYFVIIILTLVRFLNTSKAFVFPLCQTLGFTFLILMKHRSIVKYQNFKNIHLRFYYLCCFYSFAQFFQIYVAQNSLLKNLVSIIASQIFFEFVQWKTKVEFTVEEYISKKLEIQAGFYIFSFLYSKKSISKGISKALKSLSSEDNNCLIEQKTFKQSILNTKRQNIQSTLTINQSQIRQVTQKLVSMLKQNNSIYSQIFLAQLILFELGQHIKCRQILSSIKRKQGAFSFLSKILINKIQNKLNVHLSIQHDKCSSPNFYEFIQNDRFRNKLMKASLDFISLWEYTKVKQGIYKRINQLSQRVIKSQLQIQKMYKNLKVKCVQINLLYGNYLFNVQRNSSLANQIMENLYFYQQREINIQCDKKIFIRLSIHQNQPLKISSIGCNINKLLGYQRRLLTGMNIGTFMPEFFKDYHDGLVNDVLQKKTQRLFLFSKGTIIKNSRGNYESTLVCLRLSHNFDNQLFLQGFIKINNSNQHNLNNYLFVKHLNKEIIECSMLVNDKISQGKGKKFNAEQFFDHPDKNFFKKVQRFTSDLNKYFYEPILSFEFPQGPVTLFVELDPYSLNIEQHTQNQQQSSRQILIPQMIVYPKYKVFNNIKHFLRKKVSTKQLLESINIKLFIFIGIAVLMIIGIFIIQAVNISNLNKQYENKIQTMIITDNIMRHYMGLSKIGVDLSYLVANQLLGYDNPTFQTSLSDNILTVQQTNQYFKRLSLSQWIYESLSSITQYRTCYEFISEVLASASMIDQLPQSPGIRQNMIGSYNQLFTETFVWSYPQYTNRIQDQMAKKSQNRDAIQIVKIVIMFFLCVVLYILLIKVQSSSRVSQYQTLKFVGSITFQDQLIDKCKEFLNAITEQKIENISNSKTNGFNSTMNKDFINEGTKISQITARQNTGRDLMGNMSGRDTAKQTWRTANNPSGQPQGQIQTQQFPIKLRSASKVFIILPLVMLLVIFGLQVANYILNSKMKQINEAESSKNIVQWMNKPLFFTRLVNAFLTEDRGPEFTDHDNTFYKTYNLFQASYTSVATFQEVNYSQFNEFEEKLRKIRFQYLCTYANCPQTDKDYINIIYTTTMQKLAGYMLANQYFMNDPNNKMDTIMAAQQLFREIMTDLVQTYIKNYKVYAQNFKKDQNTFILVILAILIVMSIVLVIQVYMNVLKNVAKHQRICNIVKEESYMINKKDLISFEQQQLQKQKNQIKKKQLVKRKNKQKDNQSQMSQNKSQVIEDIVASKVSGKKGAKQSKKDKEKQRKVSIFKQLQMNALSSRR